MLQSCLQERLLQKVHVIRQLFLNNSNDWEETFYQSLARSYGFSVNAEPMARLAQSLPLKLILRYRDRPLGIEAALFGLAGLLEEPIRDEYQWELRREFIHLRKNMIGPPPTYNWLIGNSYACDPRISLRSDWPNLPKSFVPIVP